MIQNKSYLLRPHEHMTLRIRHHLFREEFNRSMRYYFANRCSWDARLPGCSGASSASGASSSRPPAISTATCPYPSQWPDADGNGWTGSADYLDVLTVENLNRPGQAGTHHCQCLYPENYDPQAWHDAWQCYSPTLDSCVPRGACASGLGQQCTSPQFLVNTNLMWSTDRDYR